MQNTRLLQSIHEMSARERHVLVRRYGLDGQEPATLAELSDELGLAASEYASSSATQSAALEGDSRRNGAAVGLPPSKRQPTEEHAMKLSPLEVSKPGHIVCPACGSGELWSQGSHLAICDSCGQSTDGAVLRALEQLSALPEVLGRHACECGHPEMRYLPDGVFHCPACGSEVLPYESHSRLQNTRVDSTPARGRITSHPDTRAQ